MNHKLQDIRAEGGEGEPLRCFSRKVCEICQCRLTVHQEARGGVCDRAPCRARQAAESDARRRQASAAEAEAVRVVTEKYREEVAGRIGTADSASLRLVVIPFYDQPVVKLARRRRAQFRAHLARVIREALQEETGAGDTIAMDEERRPPAHQEFDEPSVGASCAVCAGSCCRAGGTHAYLDRAAIRASMARHPGMAFRDVLKAYLSKLPDATFKGSCVYHGSNGCGLPREMRSSVCNTFYCDGMKKLRTDIVSDGPKTALLVAVEHAKISKSAIIEPDGGVVRLPESRGKGK